MFYLGLIALDWVDCKQTKSGSKKYFWLRSMFQRPMFNFEHKFRKDLSRSNVAKSSKYFSPFRQILFLNGRSRPLFYLNVRLFDAVDSKRSIYFLPTTGCELGTSGGGIDHSTNRAASTYYWPHQTAFAFAWVNR